MRLDLGWVRKLSVPALAIGLGSGLFALDRHKPDVDPESGDGILLQRIQQEPTLPRKLALLEKFVADYPKVVSITWVYEQLLPIYKDAKLYDKVIATADAMLAVDPNDLDAAHDALRAAETVGAADLISKYAEISWDVASRTVQTKKPHDPDDVADWAKQMEFATQVLSYAEYVMATQAAAETDTAKRNHLIQALSKRNPQSRFLSNARKETLVDLANISPDRAVALAEKGLLEDPNNLDFLMTVADYNISREKDMGKVVSNSLRILELMQTKAKPDSMTVDEWEKKKAKFIGWANWMVGIVYGKQARYGLSDRYLRASITYVQEDPRLLAAAYFYLGYDNYAMASEQRDKGRAIEAVKFSKLCAAIDGPFRSLARKNLEALRTEYNVE
jgi:tetratricopeptide (TPR) repeat protein